MFIYIYIYIRGEWSTGMLDYILPFSPRDFRKKTGENNWDKIRHQIPINPCTCSIVASGCSEAAATTPHVAKIIVYALHPMQGHIDSISKAARYGQGSHPLMHVYLSCHGIPCHVPLDMGKPAMPYDTHSIISLALSSGRGRDGADLEECDPALEGAPTMAFRSVSEGI